MKAYRKWLLVFFSVTILLAPAALAADELVVAAAADLQFAMPVIAQRFEKETGATVKLSFGSSGNFTNQIKNGAPYDVFVSADVSYPQQLQSEGLAEPGTLYRYANGTIVLWVPGGSRLDLNQGLSVLLNPAVQKIAIANPAHAPYGRAAEAALKHARIYEKVLSKLVLGENISQAAQFVESGSADAGILALSLALSPAMQGKGRYIEIPQQDYPPITQGCIVLKSSKHQELARKFIEFIKQPQASAVLARYGFALPHQ
jgi:molybdate transport system substrate-binding protein